MYLYCKESAFTLIELIVTIAVLAIITSIAYPSYHQFMERQEYNQLLPFIRNHVNLSKNYASVYHNRIVICPTSDLSRCENNQWHKGFIIFTDTNNNKLLDITEQIHQANKLNLKYGTLVWNGGVSNPNSVSFMNDTGLPRGSQGHFQYCSFKTPSNHTKYIVNQMGHVRAESNSCS